MKVTLTAKLKLTHSADHKAALDRVTLAYRDALNYTSGVAFELGKSSNAAEIQKEAYATLRARFGLGSQMACSVPRYVGAAYKTQWTKLKDHQKRQTSRVEQGKKARPFKGLDKAPKFISRTLTYQYNKDYSFKKEGQVSLLTLEGRLVLPYQGYQRHLDYIAQGAEIGAGKLWYDKPKKQYYLLVSFEVESPDVQPTAHKNIVGVDVGQRYHAVTTDTRSRTQFFSGQETNQKKNGFARVRQTLQRKGTRLRTLPNVALGARFIGPPRLTLSGLFSANHELRLF